MKHNLLSFLAGFWTPYFLSTILPSALAQSPPSKKLHHDRKPGSSESTSSDSKRSLPRSGEWKLLPKQKWELFDTKLSKEIPYAALDNSTKSKLNNMGGFEPQAIPSTETIPALGQIIGSRTESQYLFTNDVVYIRSHGLLQVGDTYAITDVPEILKSSKSDRTGYSYLILGKVKILAVRDDLFLGKMLSVSTFIPRGTLLIPTPPKVLDKLPIDGPTAVQGTLLFDHRFSTFTTAQHKEVFIDRGSADGLKPGMIFRVYQHYDPANDKKISSSELIVDGELQVTQVTESFSTAIVLISYAPLTENSSAVLMTDISELLKGDKHQVLGTELDTNVKAKVYDPLEELDRLDKTSSVGLTEKKKLYQLEKWQTNPPDSSSQEEKPKDAQLSPGSVAPPPPPDGVAPTPPLESTEAIPPPPGSSTSPLSSGETPPPAVDPNSNNNVDSLAPRDPGSSDNSIAPKSASSSPTEPTSGDVPPPPLLDDSSPPPPPLVPMKAETAPSPPSAAATPQDASNATVPPTESSEPALPMPPPPL